MDSEAQEALDAIRATVRPRRIRLNDFFLSFEKPGSKKCTATQFRRALDMSGVAPEVMKWKSITEAHMDRLTDHYRSTNDWMKVDYARFCDDINEVFTIKGLEKTPLKEVKLALDDEPMYYSQLGLNNPKLGQSDRAQLGSVLELLGKMVAESGLVLKDFFVDFDHNNDGCITRAEFMRNVYRLHRGISDDVAELLAEAYHVGYGVHFRALQLDMEAVSGISSIPTFSIGESKDSEDNIGLNASGAYFATKKDEENWSVNGAEEMAALERALALHVMERRIRLDVAFLEFDPLRRGLVNEPGFLQGLRRTFAVKLSAAAMRSIADKYATPTGDIAWKTFVETITALSRDLAAEFQHDREFREPKHTEVLDLLESIRENVAKRRVQLKPTFQDFDPRRNEHVTRDQFERVLAQFNLLPDSISMTKKLLDAYAAKDGRHPSTGFVNYRLFLCDIQTDLEPQKLEPGADLAFHSEASMISSVRPAGARSGGRVG